MTFNIPMRLVFTYLDPKVTMRQIIDLVGYTHSLTQDQLEYLVSQVN